MHDLDQPQVTNYDIVAERLGTWREQLPRIETALAYFEAVKLLDALKQAVEGFEKVQALERVARGL